MGRIERGGGDGGEPVRSPPSRPTYRRHRRSQRLSETKKSCRDWNLTKLFPGTFFLYPRKLLICKFYTIIAPTCVTYLKVRFAPEAVIQIQVRAKAFPRRSRSFPHS